MVSRIWQTAATPLGQLRLTVARVEPAWRVALFAFFIARLVYSAWAFIILLLFPVVAQNLELFGAPVVAVFNLEHGERYIYSRQVGGETLNFRGGDNNTLVDVESGSVWLLRDGRGVTGKYAGQVLKVADYTPEEVFPYAGVAVETNPLFGIWQRFDTNWYLKIAHDGYNRDDGSTVYFPLYPLVVRMASVLAGGRDLLAGILISNLALIGALYVLYKMTDELLGKPAARRTVAYMLIYPTAFFLFAAYTESLFLFLSLASLYTARRGQIMGAGVWGALAALTRLQGVLLFVPLAYLWWNQPINGNQVVGLDALVGYHAGVTSRLKARLQKHLTTRFEGLSLLLIPLASLAFVAYTEFSLLNSYKGELHAQFVLPWDNVVAAITLLITGRASLVDLLNLIAVILFGASLVVVWKRLPREFFLFALLMFLAPLLRMTTLQPLVSVTRYVLVMFPVFMLWAFAGKNPWLNRAVLYLSLPLNLYLSAQFWLWGWVS